MVDTMVEHAPPAGETTKEQATTDRENMHRTWLDNLPTLKPDQVVRLAIEAMNQVAFELYNGVKILEVLGDPSAVDSKVEIDPDTMKWLAAKFKQDVGEIIEHIDYAKGGLQGSVFWGASEKYLQAYREESEQ